MKKAFKIFMFVLVILLIAAAVYVFMKNGDVPGTGPSGSSGDVSGETTNLADTVMVRSISLKTETDHKSIDYEYPEITSFKNKVNENKINSIIADDISKYLDEMFIVDDNDPSIPASAQYIYKVSYEKLTYGKYLFLIVLQDYYTGGMRSIKFKDIYSIDVEAEDIVYLSQMFDPGVKFEEAIISEITKQAADRSIDLNGGNGIKSLPQNQRFYVQDGKLIIYFQPTEVAAYAHGDLTFEMPFRLKDNGTFEI